MLVSPATDRREPGVVVPIPVLPFASTVMTSVPLVCKRFRISSVVVPCTRRRADPGVVVPILI